MQNSLFPSRKKTNEKAQKRRTQELLSFVQVEVVAAEEARMRSRGKERSRPF